ncbi:aspartyl beta-hydroxylase [Sphingomonas trueperi]|uniref:aspartyl beta-hydroxylase n=1 Tax=Sphingomonas trueperi TaxID=53317 RepID=UPI000F2A819F
MRNALQAFQAAVMAAPELQRQLGACERHEIFCARAMAAAGSLGLTLAPDALAPRARAAPVEPSSAWPPREWLPVRIIESDVGPLVDWAYFGDDALEDSFFGDSIQRALSRPFNRVFRHVTGLDDFIDNAPTDEAAPLRGLVYHMSRCGSTLVAQMLGALPATLSLSEPGPFDAAVRLAMAGNDLRGARGAALLRAMVAALARARNGEGQCFIKLDSWHILAFPLIQAALPQVPWVYLFRDPVEVLVSQMRMRGYQTVPSLVPPGLYGIGDDLPGPEELCARIFAKHHEAAIRALAGSLGMAIDYADLPDALVDRIAPHFGLSLTQVEKAAVADASRRDAKAPECLFARDGERKKSLASDAVLAAVRRHVSELHAEIRDAARR